MRLPREVKAVVFDMDGLLVDSERVFRDSMMAVAKRSGREFPLDVFLSMVGAPREQNRRVALEHFGEDFDVDGWWSEVTEHAHAQFEVDSELKAGALELLDVLDAERIPRAIATSAGRDSVFRQLKPHLLLDHFGVIVAAGDYARGKPAPDPFLTAAERLGVPPRDCLALEDSHNGVRAAHAAGMMTVMVPDLLPATEEMQALSIGIAKTLHEVRDLVVDQLGRL